MIFNSNKINNLGAWEMDKRPSARGGRRTKPLKRLVLLPRKQMATIPKQAAHYASASKHNLMQGLALEKDKVPPPPPPPPRIFWGCGK